MHFSDNMITYLLKTSCPTSTIVCYWKPLCFFPGLNAGLTAVLVKYLFPYEWTWPVSLAFGTIISATDPVAVVATLKELGKKSPLKSQFYIIQWWTTLTSHWDGLSQYMYGNLFHFILGIQFFNLLKQGTRLKAQVHIIWVNPSLARRAQLVIFTVSYFYCYHWMLWQDGYPSIK